ncbi:MAG TPA: glycoside hydrolase family 127 protein [Chitinophagaceae bacterium]|jgi:hypothetical protein|nr:glycoside hydrolase family 127 protein [Chitinophagaceae bacterium]
MKCLFVLLLLLGAGRAGAQQQDYAIRAVNFTDVRFTDSFWLPRIRTNHTVTIPASFERCVTTGRVRNFEMAAARSGKFCTVYPFDDTDIYKTLEGASFSLSLFPDKKLEVYMDSLIEKVAAAQEPDGYLYTARTINPDSPHVWAGKNRWERERELSHELYNSGHLYEAAAAHFYATGKRNLLNIALKNADLVCSVFGPGKLHIAPGHQVVEMGLVKLYRITGKQEYLNTAKFFIEERGRFAGYDAKSPDPWRNGSYWQDHKPVLQQEEAIGHAVRAGYLYAAMADVAALTGDTGLLRASDRIWTNTVGKKMYVQGGIGAVGDGERFGANYELPNKTAYNETCAAIANVYWNHRMFLLHGDARYIDVLERSLYNSLLSGLGLDGKSFFYTNAMQVTKGFGLHNAEASRSGWFTCSCCPTNLTRLIPSVPGYMYAVSGRDAYVNLFAASEGRFQVDGATVAIRQQHNYPWEGWLKFTLQPKKQASFRLHLRIPGWARNEVLPSDLYAYRDSVAVPVTIRVNGQPVAVTIEKGYAVLDRTWKKGDVIEMDLPMEVRRITARSEVQDAAGRVALQRGPLVYCAEGVDHEGGAANLLLPADTRFTTAYEPGLLNGVTVLRSTVPSVVVDEKGQELKTVRRAFTAIPYYAWANRKPGELMVWFPEKIWGVDLLSAGPAAPKK